MYCPVCMHVYLHTHATIPSCFAWMSESRGKNTHTTFFTLLHVALRRRRRSWWFAWLKMRPVHTHTTCIRFSSHERKKKKKWAGWVDKCLSDYRILHPHVQYMYCWGRQKKEARKGWFELENERTNEWTALRNVRTNVLYSITCLALLLLLLLLFHACVRERWKMLLLAKRMQHAVIRTFVRFVRLFVLCVDVAYE